MIIANNCTISRQCRCPLLIFKNNIRPIRRINNEEWDLEDFLTIEHFQEDLSNVHFRFLHFPHSISNKVSLAKVLQEGCVVGVVWCAVVHDYLVYDYDYQANGEGYGFNGEANYLHKNVFRSITPRKKMRSRRINAIFIPSRTR